MKRFIIIAAISLAAVTSAQAEEFTGKCTDYATKGQEACNATQWCVWRSGREISLPDGEKVTTTTSCAFKPNFRAAFAAKQAQATKPQ
jgi:hypothetical protein